jgi:hypothetical protein
MCLRLSINQLSARVKYLKGWSYKDAHIASVHSLLIRNYDEIIALVKLATHSHDLYPIIIAEEIEAETAELTRELARLTGAV